MLGKYLLEKKQSINRDLVEEYKKMKKSEIIKKVAPCSLMCHTCSAYNDGIICVSAKTLLKYLEGIKEFYEVRCYKRFYYD